MATKRKTKARSNKANKGKLRIGDTWNAITIIALSQNNPLKAIAEFIENSIDAKAKNITIVRGKENGEPYIRITDDGEGVPNNNEGEPDFKYVATHICDSIKKQMKQQGDVQGLQGEFGIGLLSFWTVGEELHMTSTGTNGKAYQMRMVKGDPGYEVTERRTLFPVQETELLIKPLLPGVRNLSGEKIQWYLASELRDRIRDSGVSIKVTDRTSRKEFVVEPRVYTGTLIPLEALPTEEGDIYLELYLGAPDNNKISLCRNGTRVLPDITSLPHFQREPWNSGFIEGIVDAPMLNLTPGTRDGVIQDFSFELFHRTIRTAEAQLIERVGELREAEEQKTSKQVLKSVQKALKEALLALPQEEYDWFDIQKKAKGLASQPSASKSDQDDETPTDTTSTNSSTPRQKEFFEYEGALFSVTPSPATCVVEVNKAKNIRAVTRDKARRFVERDIRFHWKILEGNGSITNQNGEIISFTAGREPGLVRIEVTARQNNQACKSEALITVTDSIIPDLQKNETGNKGLPGYTFRSAPGELWRSQYDEEHNVIVINNGHRDFIYAARNNVRKLRYICRLFAKELVHKNFPGMPADQLLERMIELSLYTEDHLR